MKEEIKPYTLDQLYGILKHDEGLSFKEMRKEYLLSRQARE